MAGPKSRDLEAFATSMIRYGELLLNTMLTFLNIVLTFRMETFMFLLNELLNYNKKLSGTLEGFDVSVKMFSSRLFAFLVKF